MYELTNETIAGRKYYARLELDDGTILTNYGDDAVGITSISISQTLCGSESLSIGCVNAACATIVLEAGTALENQRFALYLGQEFDGAVEWVPMGIFTGTKAEISEDKLTVEAWDDLYFAGGDYTPDSSVTGECTLANALADVCSGAGLTFSGEVPSLTIAGMPTGLTYSAAIGYLAALLGANACMDRDGCLAFRQFGESGQVLGTDDCYSGGMVFKTSDFTVASLTNTLETETTGDDGETTTETTEVERTTGAAGGSIALTNPIMTEDNIDTAWDVVKGFTYRPATLTAVGQLAVDVGDVLRVPTLTGGRNYLTGTRDFDSGIWYKSSNVTLTTDNEDYTVATWAATSTLGWNVVRTTNAPIQFSLVRGQSVVLSFDVRSDDYEALNALTNQGLAVAFNLYASGGTTRTLYRYCSLYTTALTNDWQRITVAATLTDDYFTSGSGEINDDTRFCIAIYDYSLYSMQVRKVKLEIGNVATDWTPAPEDDDESIYLVPAMTHTLEYDGGLKSTITAAGESESQQSAAVSGPVAQQIKELTTKVADTKVLASGKNAVYYSAIAPSGGTYSANDIWYDTENGYAMYYWNGSAWVKAVYGASALSDEVTADIAAALEEAGLVKEAIDNLSIGGRNLILDSEEISATRSDTTQNHIREQVPFLSNSDYGIARLAEGGEFTLSFDYEITGITTACNVYLALKNTSSAYARGNVDFLALAVGNNSGHYSCTFTPTEAQMEYGVAWLFNGFGAGDNANAVITLRHVKFETGNTETDWTPAPEDEEAAIEEVTTIVNGKTTSYYADTVPGGTNYTTGDIWFDTENGYAMYYWNGSEWVKAVYGASALSEEVTADIAAALEEAGLAKEAIDNISVGARNLILDSEEISATRSDTTQNHIREQVPFLSNSDYGIARLAEGGEFTLSFDYEITGITTACNVYLALKNTSSAYARGNVDFLALAVGNNSGHYSCTFTPTEAQMEYGVAWLFNGFGAGDNANAVITLRHVKFETGNTETDWTPAPEDEEAAIEEVTTIVNGKTTSYYADTVPSGTNYTTGDIWFDTANDNAMYYWNGSAWTLAPLGTDAIADGAITADLIAASAITAGKISSGAVTTDKLAANAVTAAKIAAGTITSTQIAAGTITGDNIASSTITAGKISSGAVTTDKLAANAVTAAKIAASTITSTQIAAGTITGDNIAASTITAGNLVAGTITSNEIASGTITAEKLNVAELSAITANLGTVIAGDITGVKISGSKFASVSSEYLGSVSIEAGVAEFLGDTLYDTSGSVAGKDSGGAAYWSVDGCSHDTGFPGRVYISDGDIILNSYGVGEYGGYNGLVRLTSSGIRVCSPVYYYDYYDEEDEESKYVCDYGTKAWMTIDTPSKSVTIDGTLNVTGEATVNNFRVPEIQHGYVDVTPSAAGERTSAEVTFDVAFSGTPTVTATVQTNVPDNRAVGVMSISTTGFTVYVYSSGSNYVRVHWIAVY